MSYVNIKFIEEIRKIFQKGEEINFDFSDKDVILITGPNGSGKSTIINSLRSHICSNDDRQNDGIDGTANLQYSEICSELKPYTEVNTDFDNIFYLSSEFDDPLSMYTTWDACAFIDNGGWATSHISKGQRLLYQFAQYMKKYKEKFNNSLLIFDEVDTGYDLKNQVMFYKLLPKMCKKHNCKCLVVTHCPIPFIYGDYSIYDMKEKKFVGSGKEYIENIINSVK